MKSGLSLYDIPWPGDAFDATLNAPPESGNPPWLGSLLVEKTDASGQMYMRNRYFDPQSGRFTQEDPIGLAGGLNLYGFGGGDAVNYSDPFGLSSCKSKDVDDCKQKEGGRAQEHEWTNPTGKSLRGCDSRGCGHYGASRGGRIHEGADYVADPGQDVVSVTDGKVSRIGWPYNGNSYYRYVEIVTEDGYVVREMYVTPSEGIRPDVQVEAGQVIGTQQPLSPRYPGITEHVHVEVRHGGVKLDPTTVIPNP